MQRQKQSPFYCLFFYKPSAHIEAINKRAVTYHANKGILFIVIRNFICMYFSMHVLSDGLCILKAKLFKFVVIVSSLAILVPFPFIITYTSHYF